MALRVFSFYFIFAPAGAALSIDRWRRCRATLLGVPSSVPVRPFASSRSSSASSTSRACGPRCGARPGTTARPSPMPSRIGELVRLELPAQITESLVLSNLATYGTLALERGLGVLIWNRRARP